jgi:hypothetical protein
MKPMFSSVPGRTYGLGPRSSNLDCVPHILRRQFCETSVRGGTSARGRESVFDSHDYGACFIAVIGTLETSTRLTSYGSSHTS